MMAFVPRGPCMLPDAMSSQKLSLTCDRCDNARYPAGWIGQMPTSGRAARGYTAVGVLLAGPADRLHSGGSRRQSIPVTRGREAPRSCFEFISWDDTRRAAIGSKRIHSFGLQKRHCVLSDHRAYGSKTSITTVNDLDLVTFPDLPSKPRICLGWGCARRKVV